MENIFQNQVIKIIDTFEQDWKEFKIRKRTQIMSRAYPMFEFLQAWALKWLPGPMVSKPF